MDLKELSQFQYKYVRIKLDNETERYENVNFPLWRMKLKSHKK